MDFKLERKVAYALLVVVFAAAMAAAFQSGTLTDADYGILNKSGISLESMKLYGDALVVALPLLVYLLAAYALKADEFHSLVAALLVAAGGASGAALVSIPPLLAAALGKQYVLLDAMKMAGAVLPLGLVAIAGYRKEPAAAILAALGAVALPFAPGISVVLLGLAASKGIGELEHASYGDKAIVVAVLIFAFQGVYSADISAALVASVLVAAIAYVAISLHNVKKDEVAALLLLFVAFSVIGTIYSLNAANAAAPWDSEIEMFRAAKGIGGQFSVFDYPEAFAYYSGKDAAVLNASAIARKNSDFSGEAAISARALDAAYPARAIVFAYAGQYVDSYGRQTAAFGNQHYMLYMHVQGGELAVEDAQLYDENGESAVIPYTKVRQLFPGNFTSRSNRLINVQEIEGSALYSMLFDSTLQFVRNGSGIAEVR